MTGREEGKGIEGRESKRRRDTPGTASAHSDCANQGGEKAGYMGVSTVKIEGDFHGGSVVKKPPANAGDAGSIPDLGRCHMPQSN